jgi:hypothetical protein
MMTVTRGEGIPPNIMKNWCNPPVQTVACLIWIVEPGAPWYVGLATMKRGGR